MELDSFSVYDFAFAIDRAIRRRQFFDLRFTIYNSLNMSRAQQAKTKKTSAKTYLNYIGGESVKSSSAEWFDNINPADSNDVVGRFPLTNADDVNRTVEAAKSAATRWRKTPAPKRAE